MARSRRVMQANIWVALYNAEGLRIDTVQLAEKDVERAVGTVRHNYGAGSVTSAILYDRKPDYPAADHDRRPDCDAIILAVLRRS